MIRRSISLPRKRLEVAILAKQMIRSGTSVAAHARETSRAHSDSEFCSKIDILLQEAYETQFWLKLLEEDCGISDPTLKQAHQETEELLAIFTTIVSRTRNKP
ncbi:MAG: four helix bundle protein [Verrucomicrobia bacterium]|nr:four helix bundle protein [Verrucomicrobiota bacterium]